MARLAAVSTDLHDPDVVRLLDGVQHDPFRVLGRHPLTDGLAVVRVWRPAARSVLLVGDGDGAAFHRVGDSELFEWVGPIPRVQAPYRVLSEYGDGVTWEEWDAYAFGPMLDDAQLQRFGAGEHHQAHRLLGAHVATALGIPGMRFAVWAPEACRVSVVGDFNAWDGRRHPMRVRGGSGVWELFVPGLEPGGPYKFELRNRHGGAPMLRADPYARAAELRPGTASLSLAPSAYVWSDDEWLQARAARDWLHAPMSVYEVHAGSWRRDDGGRPLTYRELAQRLVPWVRDLGFTHIELLPLTEYPLDESWGYQPAGFFAPTRRYGDPDDLRHFVDQCHRHGLGVLLDWVPGHFPRDEHWLANFDGSALYEYADPRKGAHPDWGTLVFNYDRNEVRSFLLSSALYWLQEFHFDGLRVDAVASMLYLDYSREHGQWIANVHGGNENLEAIAFLRRLNELTHAEVPGSLTVAEESTAWPGVSRPAWAGGLGFSMKWNMGWMHDTLKYLSLDPIYRSHHHGLINFAALYAFSENFVLPLSHDEVVHGKGSLLGKMAGADDWQRFAHLRLLYTLQWTFPGKKLLFMGGELAQPAEWDARATLPWHLLDEPYHHGILRLVQDLNRLYRDAGALHRHDFEPAGFQWLRWGDHQHSTLAYLRADGDGDIVVLLNFTPMVRPDYAIGVPRAGTYTECFNSDSRYYGGSDVGNPLPAHTVPQPCDEHPHTLRVTLPPLGAVLLRREPLVHPGH